MKKEGAFRLTTLLLLAFGLTLMAFGIWAELRYDDLVRNGNLSVALNRFDTIDYERAKRFPMASSDLLAYNLGVLAYKAGNFERAADSFREAIDLSRDAQLKGKAYYNLGNIFAIINQPKVAANMYREALRINPTDWDAKYNLERLYVFNPKLFSEEGRAVSLEQAPSDKSRQFEYGTRGSNRRNLEPGV